MYQSHFDALNIKRKKLTEESTVSKAREQLVPVKNESHLEKWLLVIEMQIKATKCNFITDKLKYI